MDLIDLAALADEVREVDVAVAVGGRTQWEVGGRAAPATEVRAPEGIVTYDPAELTVTAGAGTTVAELDAAVGACGQEVGLDSRSGDATLGGVLATGLSGCRRLRYGPVRDTVLEMRIVCGNGGVVTAGGPTVKNVTGYDLPRLLVGSLGTLGVVGRVILRCRPRPRASQWFCTAEPAGAVLARLYRPSAVLGDGSSTWILLEGHPDDVTDEGIGLTAVEGAPAWPEGEHRGRVSVNPAHLDAVLERLCALDASVLAEWGVGTVHVAAAAVETLVAARAIAEHASGWLLREAGGGDMDAWGRPLPDRDLHRRLKVALDPARKLGRGRMPW